ncbi:class I SAM-dependent methyltransferase [Haematomicrobium sanguinis]|uniref:class I SAM-dependent methyltransferase n=1 Tax=Haematomicrobium sanguinis TaxID=479106 RepID=UPI0006905E02|nr:class I SAM-dependent methyltransferase [Haematomicrobium sanguinis]
MHNRGPKLDDAQRTHFSSAFNTGGERYERLRPGYPAEAVDWLLPEDARRIVDLGAGTGKLTEQLVHRVTDVFAVDPSADMLAHVEAKLPGVRTIEANAEDESWVTQTGGALDAVLVAQAWHWFDVEAASARIRSALRPGGTLGLIWNQLDVTVPWVHRLSRIMHAGDVLRHNFRPPLGTGFTPIETREVHWQQELAAEELIELAQTRSYFLKATEATRAKVLANLHWYLFEHLGHRPGEIVELHYVTQAYRAFCTPGKSPRKRDSSP